MVSALSAKRVKTRRVSQPHVVVDSGEGLFVRRRQFVPPHPISQLAREIDQHVNDLLELLRTRLLVSDSVIQPVSAVVQGSLARPGARWVSRPIHSAMVHLDHSGAT